MSTGLDPVAGFGLAVPRALLLRDIKLGAPVPMGHLGFYNKLSANPFRIDQRTRDHSLGLRYQGVSSP